MSAPRYGAGMDHEGQEYTGESIRNHYLTALGRLFEIRGGNDQAMYQDAEIEWEHSNSAIFYWPAIANGPTFSLYPSFIRLFGEPDVTWGKPYATLHNGCLAVGITLVDHYTGEDIGMEPGNYEVTMLRADRLDDALEGIDIFPRAYIERRLCIVTVYGTPAGPLWIDDLFRVFADDRECRTILERAAKDEKFHDAILAARHVDGGVEAFVKNQLQTVL